MAGRASTYRKHVVTLISSSSSVPLHVGMTWDAGICTTTRNAQEEHAWCFVREVEQLAVAEHPALDRVVRVRTRAASERVPLGLAVHVVGGAVDAHAAISSCSEKLFQSAGMNREYTSPLGFSGLQNGSQNSR